MKPNNLIKSILLTSVASFLHNNTNAAKIDVAVPSITDGTNAVNLLKNKLIKNVIKIKSNGGLSLIAGHRSHRSHSSHSSHRSGSSGSSYRGSGSSSSKSYGSSSSKSYGSGSSYSSPSSTYKSSSSTPSSTTTPSTYTTPSTTTATEKKATPTAVKPTISTYKLGQRVLKKGLYGADVNELANLLNEKKYVNKDLLSYREGFVAYDVYIESVIKTFQKDADIQIDGITSKNTIDKLKNWYSKPTYTLGIRTLNTNNFGADVTELIELLTKAGFPPDPAKMEYSMSGAAMYSEDIICAIKLFQAFSRLNVTGVLDAATIKKLLTYK